MDGELAESPILRELSLFLKRLPSDKMMSLLDALSSVAGLDISDIVSDLSSLIKKHASSTPLRSGHDQQHATLRTTVIAHRVSLSKHQATLSDGDSAYSQLLDKLDADIQKFFSRTIVSPKNLPLNEIFIFDSKGLCRNALGPSPRKAIERALTFPFDYLNCECCVGEEGLKASNPVTSTVYQLYLESGSMLNVADTWTAFQTITLANQDQDAEDDEEYEAQVQKQLALFYRALAELQYLGFIKGSRKKTAHVAKLKWKGL